MRVVVLGGGEDEERAVAASTACAAAAVLRLTGHDVNLVDPARWPDAACFASSVPDSVPDSQDTLRLTQKIWSNLASDAFWTESEKADVVFLALVGGIGESGP